MRISYMTGAFATVLMVILSVRVSRRNQLTEIMNPHRLLQRPLCGVIPRKTLSESLRFSHRGCCSLVMSE